jgi:plastocyanin
MTRILVALAVALVGFVACSNADAGKTPASGEPAFEVNGAPIDTTEVTAIKSYKFEPQVISVTAGATVTWTNEDDFPHNVRLLDDDTTHDLPIGESVDVTFEEAGEYLYECSIHPQQMRGKVVVE